MYRHYFSLSNLCYLNKQRNSVSMSAIKGLKMAAMASLLPW